MKNMKVFRVFLCWVSIVSLKQLNNDHTYKTPYSLYFEYDIVLCFVLPWYSDGKKMTWTAQISKSTPNPLTYNKLNNHIRLFSLEKLG